jgi:ABC-type transport system involved in multi-copper enzyme maturation permease subunit
MSVIENPPVVAPGVPISGDPGGSSALRGVRLVAAHEFRMRLRTGRWKWLLGSWVVVVFLFTLLLDTSLRSSRNNFNGGPPGSFYVDTSPVGPQLFGALMLFVLGLTLLISPALTSQSINGDRERGTLATLQVTLLSAREIALGKLLAGWSVGLVALGLTVPFVIWSLAEGGVGVLRALVTLLIVALLVGVICAVSQALSALLTRSITSGLLSYVVTFALTVGTLIAFGLALSLTDEQVHHTDTNTNYSYTSTESHSERVWWILAPNPFVILADAAPALPPLHDPRTGKEIGRPSDPLATVRDSVRRERRGNEQQSQQCAYFDDSNGAMVQNPYGLQVPLCPKPTEPPAVWPWGLGFDVLLGVGAVWVTTRRLRTPANKLGRGVRVA